MGAQAAGPKMADCALSESQTRPQPPQLMSPILSPATGQYVSTPFMDPASPASTEPLIRHMLEGLSCSPMI